eukprot:GDKJ01020351.1.p1 GENE.GDKJ01020351.1~~GDKJ01020351.1.p1  ORF type:complete len:510 (+),score=38.76 GDKJ01020351.1:34-1563(+)
MGYVLTDEEFKTLSFRSFSSTCVAFFGTFASFNFGYTLGILNIPRNIIIQNFEMCGNAFTFSCTAALNRFRFITPVVFLGAFFGALTASRIANHGRILCLHVTNLFFIVGHLIVAFSFGSSKSAFIQILIGRFIAGLGVGSTTVIVPIFIMENSPLSRRGMYNCFHPCMINFGVFMSVAICLPLTQPNNDNPMPPANFEKWYWRFVVLIACCVSVAQILFFWKFKESASFYINKATTAEHLDVNNPNMIKAKQSLQKIYPNEIADLVLSSMINQKKYILNSTSRTENLNFFQILGHPLHRKVLFFAIVMVLLQASTCINVVVTQSNSLFLNAGMEAERVSYVSLAVNFGFLFASIIILFFVDKIGRKKLLVWGVFGISVFMGPSAICFWFQDHLTKSVMSTLAAVSLVGFGLCFNFSIGAVSWLWITEILVPSTINTSMGVAGCCNWLAQTFLVFGLGYGDIATTFNFCFWSSIVSFFSIILMVKETSGKKYSPYYKFHENSQIGNQEQ